MSDKKAFEEFVKKHSKYAKRFDCVLDVRNPLGYTYDNTYKIYDKYDTVFYKTDLNYNQIAHAVRAMNENEIAYLRVIYDYAS